VTDYEKTEGAWLAENAKISVTKITNSKILLQTLQLQTEQKVSGPCSRKDPKGSEIEGLTLRWGKQKESRRSDSLWLRLLP
jgi:hypothetical protein